MSPAARTLAELRKQGWTAQVVEKWNPHSKTRLDLGGGIDVLAWRPESVGKSFWRPIDPLPTIVEETTIGKCILGVQATSGTNHSSRKAKLLKEPRMATWLAAGGRLEVWSWAKQGARGARKVWGLRREPLTLSDFIPEAT